MWFSLGSTSIVLVQIFVIARFIVTINTANSETMDINIDDILSTPFMPVSWLVMDDDYGRHGSAKRDEPMMMRSEMDVDYGDMGQVIENRSRMNGSFDSAFSTMGFHRQMMKEYMCSNFLASQILHEAITPTHIQRKLGVANDGSSTINPNPNRSLKASLVQNMRFDEGSSEYKNWLAKSTTLNDIYSHYILPNISASTAGPVNGQRHLTSRRRQDKPVHEDYEEGDVTGYALQQPMDPNIYAQSAVNTPLDYMGHLHEISPTAGSKSVYPHYSNLQWPVLSTEPIASHEHTNDYPSAFYEPLPIPPDLYETPSTTTHKPQHALFSLFGLKEKLLSLLPFQKRAQHNPPKEHQHLQNIGYEYSNHDGGGDSSSVQKGGSYKEMGLKDLFDIALTTLAFLSFGMFILQVLMCVTMSKSDNSNMIMLPMEEVPTDTETLRRKRRSAEYNMPTLQMINDLTKKVLLSIEAAQMTNDDNGKCLWYSLCETSKYSRSLKNNQKMWLPVWNLGLSWLASRLFAERTKTWPIIEGLKATAFGLGQVQCLERFPCQISKTKYA